MGDLSRFSFQFDFINAVYLPFILITLNDLRKNWGSVVDDSLTLADRAMLKRVTIFLLLPCIVLVHELGHYFAALSVGARVLEFHYGFVSGFVKIFPDRTASEFLWIAFAGNLVQIVIGFLSLLLAAIVRPPFLVAISVYFGLFAVAETAVFYAMLSAVGAYGDWIDIYTSTDRGGVTCIAIFHGVVLLSLFYMCFGHWPRYWFACRTMPGWYDAHRELERVSRESPSYETLEPVCVSWIRAGFPVKAEQLLQQMVAMGNRPQIKLLQGRIFLIKGNVEGAIRCFNELINDPQLNESGRARLCVEAGDILMNARQFQESLNLFSKAVELDPLLGDARLFKAIMLNSISRHAEALGELTIASDPEMIWAVPDNSSLVVAELQRSRAALNATEGKS